MAQASRSKTRPWLVKKGNAAAFGLLAVAFATPALAQNSTTGSFGDWFDADLWSEGRTPNTAEGVLIPNAEVIASSDSPNRPPGLDLLEITDLSIGAVDFLTPLEEQQGSLEVEGLGIRIVDELKLGTSFNGASGTGLLETDGSIELQNNLAVGRALVIQGLPGEDTLGSIASGTLRVAGDLVQGFRDDGIDPSPNTYKVIVAESMGANSSGRIEVGGDFIGGLGFNVTIATMTTRIGSSLSQEAVSSNGSLHVEGGASFGNTIVGQAFREGTTHGTIDVQGDLTTGAVQVGSVGGIPHVDQSLRGVLATGTVTVGGDLKSSTVFAADSTIWARPDSIARGRIAVGGALVGDNSVQPGRTSLTIGRGETDGTATGSVEAEAIRGIASVRIGWWINPSQTVSGMAAGSLLVRSGGISAPDDRAIQFNSIEIGTNAVEGAGIGTGSADVTGDITGFGRVQLGVGGRARGDLVLRNGRLYGQSLELGVSAADAGRSRLELIGSSVEITDVIRLGTNALVSIQLGAASSPGSTAVLEAGSIQMDGILELVFDGRPAAGVYELLSATGEEGLTNDFDEISVSGIDRSLLLFSFDQEPGPGSSTVRRALRMTVVPEASTALLMGLGLLALATGRAAERTPSRIEDGKRRTG